jgi:hypothetical protein
MQNAFPALWNEQDGLSRKQLLHLLILLSALAFAAFHRFQHLNDVAIRSPDEQIYNAQSTIVARSGLEGFRTITSAYNANPRLWSYPPPNRVTTIALNGFLKYLTGIYDDRVPSYISLASSIGTLLLLAWIAFRFYDLSVAAFAVSIGATSLIELALARRGWQDAHFELLSLALFYVVCETNFRIRDANLLFLTAVVGVLVLLTKQTGIIVVSSLYACLIWRAAVSDGRVSSVALVAASGLSSLFAAVTIQVALAGGIDAAVSTYIHSISPSADAQNYISEQQSGSPISFLGVFFRLNPAASLFFAAALLFAAKELRHVRHVWRAIEPSILPLAVIPLLSLLVFLACKQGLQNYRFVSPVLSLYFLCSAIGCKQTIDFVDRKFAAGDRLARSITIGCWALLGFGCWLEYALGNRLLDRNGLGDLAINWLRRSL